MQDDNTPLLSDFGSVREAEVGINSRKDELSVIDQAERYCTASIRPPELYNPQRGSTLDTRYVKLAHTLRV